MEIRSAWRLPLRRWQRDAFDAWWADRARDALIVATPGAGKTRFAARLAHAALASGSVQRIFVVVPREHLKSQTASSMAQVGIHVDDRFSNASVTLAPDVHGAVVTYQQVSMAPKLYRDLTKVPTLVILDEIHHAGDGATWGAALKEAFGHAVYRVSLSGTPFRSDGTAIPFVHYERSECIPDYSYDYADALRDGVCRPLMFPLQGGYAEWVSKEGERHAASFEQTLASKSRMSERLRTVLLHPSWIGDVIEKSHARLMQLRHDEHADAGGLIIAMNQEHARFLAALVETRTKAKPTVVLSDEDGASKKIAKFAKSNAPWIVAVHMVSEGVDIPRLRIGVYASNVVTEMYFRQFCGRFVRAQRGGSTQHAFVYLPDDMRLRELASRVTADVRGMLATKVELGDFEYAQRAQTEATGATLFEAIDASVGGERVLDYGPLFNPAAFLTEEAPTTMARVAVESEPEVPVLSISEEKELLRRSISALVSQVSTRFRIEHKKIHATFNQRFGGPIATSTVDGLRKRREAALRWLDRGYDGVT